jgi:hypothetical protein
MNAIIGAVFAIGLFALFMNMLGGLAYDMYVEGKIFRMVIVLLMLAFSLCAIIYYYFTGTF